MLRRPDTMIERCIINRTERTRSSIVALERFLKKWSKPLDLLCEDHKDDAVTAGYYIWARYTMSVRTLAHLTSPQFLPDLLVIARCCFEYRAALQGLLKDHAIAGQYLGFEKHALCSYKKYLEDTDRTEQAAEVDKVLKKMGVSDCSKHKARGWWKGGYTKLVRDHGGPNDAKCYELLSDFVHGSIVALRFLQHESPATDSSTRMSSIVYHGYLSTSNEFLERAWGSITTEDSKQCREEFADVVRCLLD